MSGTPLPRPPPQVIRVPPPATTGEPLMLAILGVIILFVGLSVGITLPRPGNWVVGALGLAVAGPVFFWSRYELVRYRRERAKMLANHPGLEEQPLVAALVAAWHKRQPTPQQVRDVLAQQARDGGQAAQVVCLGAVAVPEIGEMLFEPYIITATDLIWRRLLVVPFGLAVVTVWLVQAVHLVPGRFSILGGFAYLVVGAVTAVAVWVWKSGIRPTYVRLAPGSSRSWSTAFAGADQ